MTGLLYARGRATGALMVKITIDELALDQDIGSHEGVGIDHLARMRMAFLLDQNKTMSTQTKFADAKAGALLAFIGLIATRGPAQISELTLATVAISSLHGAVLIACLIVLYPRYLSRSQRNAIAETDHYSWPALAADTVTPGAFSAFMRSAQFSQLVHSMAHANVALSHILMSKFAWLRRAFVMAVIDVLAQGAFLVAGL